MDSHGNAYVTGQAGSPDFPVKNAFQSSNNGLVNAFLSKLNADGNALVYSTYLGGNNFDSGSGVAVDSHGNAYVTGFSISPDFPTKNAFQNSWPGSPNFSSTAFLTKFDPAGTALVYSTYLGGSGGDQGDGIALDAQDHVFVTGATRSSDFPTKDAFQEKLKSSNGNAFITKFHYDGSSLFYSTYLGGSGADEANGIAVDSSGNAYVTGFTRSPDFPTKNAFEKTPSGSFITKIDAAGTALIYSTYFYAGGSGIALDAYRNTYILGAAGPGLPTKTPFRKSLAVATRTHLSRNSIQQEPHWSIPATSAGLATISERALPWTFTATPT